MADRRDVLRQREVARDGFVAVGEVLVVHRLRLLDERIDDVDLPPFGDLLPHEAEQFEPRGVGVVECLDGPPSRRQLVDHRHVEIAVEGHRQRAGDRRGGHHEDMGRLEVLGPEPRALLDAEAVLFVDHDEAQVRELHAVLDQRMRADEYVHFARGDAFERSPALPGLRGAGQDGHLHVHSVEHLADGGVVLAGEDFRRGHHAGLEAVVHREQHRHQRHEGLAAAHVALKQAVHLESRHGVPADLPDDPFLRPGEREGEFFGVEGVEHAPDPGEEEAVAFREAFGAPLLDVELHAQQFVELQPVLRLPQGLLRLREVDIVDGVAQADQSVPGAHGLGKRVRDAVLHERPGVADDLVHALRAQHIAQLLGRGIDALHAAFGLAREGLLHGFQLGMGDRQFAAVERRAAEDEVFASDLDPFLDPLDALKPHQLGLSRGVLREGREAAFAPCSGIGDARYAGAELDVGQACGLGDLRDAVDACAVDIAERIVAEHVAQRADAQLPFEEFCPGLADARYEFDVVIECIHPANIVKVERNAKLVWALARCVFPSRETCWSGAGATPSPRGRCRRPIWRMPLDPSRRLLWLYVRPR